MTAPHRNGSLSQGELLLTRCPTPLYHCRCRAPQVNAIVCLCDSELICFVYEKMEQSFISLSLSLSLSLTHTHTHTNARVVEHVFACPICFKRTAIASPFQRWVINHEHKNIRNHFLRILYALDLVILPHIFYPQNIVNDVKILSREKRGGEGEPCIMQAQVMSK